MFVGTSIAETLVGVLGPEADYDFRPELAREWSISPDNLVWTFRLQEGVQFHKGYGEMTADDVIWTFEQSVAEGSRSVRQSQYQRLWANEQVSMAPRSWATGAEESCTTCPMTWGRRQVE